jgi:hypothetical protein
MDWLTFFAALIKSLAWPVVVGIGLCLIRAQLRDLTADLAELSFMGSKAVFNRRLRRAAEEAEAIIEASQQPDTATIGAEVEQPTPALSDPFLDLASKHPTAAALEAFSEVESVVNEYRSAFPNENVRNPLGVLNALEKHGFIDKSVTDLYLQLKHTRAAAIRAPSLTPGEAIEFRNLCRTLADQIRVAMQKKRGAG